MKRVLGILFLLLMLLLVGLSAEVDKGEVKEEPKEIIETIEYLTSEDFSLLYSCKPEVRHEDERIVELSYEDVNVLMAVMRQEGGVGLQGQLWVGRTILNRFDDGWGDTLWEILNADKQFEVVKNGSYKNADINANTHIAMALIEGGWDKTKGALYWEANSNSDQSWHKRNLTFIKEVEGNLFYK